MKHIFNGPFLRRVERWLVGLVMMAIAYALEKAVLRSISSSEQKNTTPYAD